MFSRLPAEVQQLALEKHELFKRNPIHPSSGFQQKGGVCAAVSSPWAPLLSEV
jgi:hypothetical protein